ncbi:uncharacterized protein VTP21DRAFT_2500 [Calcarisporiella thermophila]|uniref:uncharacterized protein n=1 Tax=Calcarisporiella thermophila TaxID=911321 RepID=UPI0037426F66
MMWSTNEVHTLDYAANLPYAADLSGEAEAMLKEIVLNLSACVQVGDWAPGCVMWVKRLNSYLDLKHLPPRPVRAQLARLLYELATTPGVDPPVVQIFANACARLIKNKKRLGQSDLTLPWKPLYTAIEHLFFKKPPRYIGPEILGSLVSSLIRLANAAERFYPPTATPQALAEFLPMFYLGDISLMLRAQSLLVLFLPKSSFPSDPDASPQQWLPTIFRLWSTVTHSTAFDAQFIALVAAVAKRNVGVPSELGYSQPFGLFSNKQVRWVFSAGLKMFQLQVGSSMNGMSTATYGYDHLTLTSSVGVKEDIFQAFAKFVVYTIFPVSSNEVECTMKHLSNLIQAVESYFHPSNSGRWTSNLTRFLYGLANEFLVRWRKEHEDVNCTTPSERRLTPEIRHEFVATLRGITFLGMFGKDTSVVENVHKTLKCLAWLEPSLIFPGLLERVYPSLETLTETHRTTTSIASLAFVARPLLDRSHYPAGAKHLVPLLQLVLPGLDLNDQLKTWYSLMFIASAVLTVPIYDLTRTGSGGGSRYQGVDIDAREGELMPVSNEEEDALVKASTGGFEEWLANFLRRVFAILENLPQDQFEGSGSGNVEGEILRVLTTTCDLLAPQLSQELHELALRMIVGFVSSNVISNAIRAIGDICEAFTTPDPAKALRHFLPLCRSNIILELSHGAASMPTLSTTQAVHSDTTLHWYQAILSRVANYAGKTALEYKAELIEVLKEMLGKCKARRGYMWASECLLNLLASMTSIYPTDYRSLDSESWAQRELFSDHHRFWGSVGNPERPKIQWHVPSSAEIDYALELLDLFLKPSLARLRDLIEHRVLPGSSRDITVEFCLHLTVVNSCLLGTSTLIPEDGSEEDGGSQMEIDDDELTPEYYEAKRLSAGYCLINPTDPRYQTVRHLLREVGDTLRELSRYFRTKREDDVESLKLVIKTIGVFLSNRGVARAEYEAQKQMYEITKKHIKAPEDHKRYPRGNLVKRMQVYHLLRLRLNAHNRKRTRLHDDLLLELTELSLSTYAEIRKTSQSMLIVSGRSFLGAKPKVLPYCLDALMPNEHDTGAKRLKGALYLLSNKSFLHTCIRDWRFVPQFLVNLCKAQHSDKPSVQKMIQVVMINSVMSYYDPSFVATPTAVLAEFAEQLEKDVLSDPNFKLVSKDMAKVKRRTEKKRNAVIKLEQTLLEVASDPSAHWRYILMATTFLSNIQRPEIAPSETCAAFAADSMISEIRKQRELGFVMLGGVLLRIKQRTLAKGDERLIASNRLRNPLKREVATPVPLPDDFTENFLKAAQMETTLENASAVEYVDKTYIGWYVWPITYEVYDVCTNQVILSDIETACEPAFNRLRSSLCSEEWWNRLSTYTSQEAAFSREEHFKQENARLYKKIFQLFGEEALEASKPSLIKLCRATDQKSHQRAAAELMAGIIRGCKHWNLEKIARMWSFVIPLLRETLAAVNPDTIGHWNYFFKNTCRNRDPRRLRPLIELIYGMRFDPTSHAAFTESAKLTLRSSMLQTLSWRLLPASLPLLDQMLENVQHPYKQVRTAIANNIRRLHQMQWNPSYASVAALVEENKMRNGEGLGVGGLELRIEIRERMDELLSQLATWRSERVTPGSDYVNASKTILTWILDAIQGLSAITVYPIVLSLLPELFHMREIADDPDLQSLATRTFNAVAASSYPPDLVTPFLDTLIRILTENKNWHIRVKSLPVLQVFFFRHLFLFNREQMVWVTDVVGRLLMDVQVEVRQLAAVTLSGLIRCSQRDAIDGLRARFSRLLETPLPSRKRLNSTERASTPVGFHEALLRRHAGVLGLSCLVQAFPYEVPEWMPAVLVQLAGCITDPAPIQATVRKTFADFRRTHQDTWHEHVLQFTEDQLSLLTDLLISPSYYA